MRKPPQPKQKLTVLNGTTAYQELKYIIEKQGILKRSYGYYFLLTSFAISSFFLSAYYIAITPLSWTLVIWALLISFSVGQLAGLLHDAGHRAIFATTKMNDILGHVMAGFLGMPFDDWRVVHNKHHAHTNQEGEDPDIELPLISLTRERYLARKGLSKLLRPYQMYLWYPIGSFVGFTKRIYGYKYFKRKLRKENAWQLVLYIFGLFIWFVLPFLVFDITKALTVFLVTNLASGFYLANVFAPNHKGMPQLPKNIKISFLEHQIITSRNIYGHWFTDFVYFGLNYQIEHHLFPNCPRNKLKLITPHVLALCKKMDLEYTRVSVLESNRIILSELQKVTQLPDKT